MRNIVFCFITIFQLTFLGCSCKKEKISPADLPPATQDGKNTLGFLLHGQAWTPQGFNGTANLSLSYDATFLGGVFNLAAYRYINPPTDARQRIVMYGDSIQAAQRIILPSANKFGIILRNDLTGCEYQMADSAMKITGGYFDIQILDKAKGIFAGEFEIRLTKTGCETVEITKGRFDMKF